MNCPSCSKKINPKALRCPFCKTLLVSQEKFDKVVIERREKSRIKEEKDYIKSGRNTLFIVGGVSLIPVIMYLTQDDSLSAIIQSVYASIFIILGFVASKNAYAALLWGIIFYGLGIMLAAIGDPSSIIKGVIFKGIIIYYLVKGISNASKYRSNKKKVSTDLLDDFS